MFLAHFQMKPIDHQATCEVSHGPSPRVNNPNFRRNGFCLFYTTGLNRQAAG